MWRHGSPQQSASLRSSPKTSSVTRFTRMWESRSEAGPMSLEATALVLLLNGGLWNVLVAIDISRECIALIRQNWTIITGPKTVALGLVLVGGGVERSL